MGAVLGYNNYITDPGGEWLGDATGFDEVNLARLLTVHLAEAAVDGSEFPTALSFRRRFSEDPVPVQLVALLAHTLAPGAVVSLKLWDAPSGVPVWESPSVEPWLPPVGFQRHLIELLDEPVLANSLEVTTTGPFLDDIPAIGHIWASPIWYEPDGIDSEWRMRSRDLSELRRTPGGQGFDRRFTVARELHGSLGKIPVEHAFGRAAGDIMDLQQLGHLVGTTRRVLSIHRTESDHMIHRTGIYGRMPEGIPLDHEGGDFYRVPEFTVEELF